MASFPWPVAASLVAAAGTLYLIGHLRQYRGKPGAGWFLASLGCQTVWSVGYGVALLVYDPVLRAALEALVWAGMTGTSVAFLAFALAYTGRAHLPGGWWTVVAVPTVVALVGATNPLHGAVWTGFELAPVAGAEPWGNPPPRIPMDVLWQLTEHPRADGVDPREYIDDDDGGADQ